MVKLKSAKMCACSAKDSVYDPESTLNSDIDLDYDPDYNPDAEGDDDWNKNHQVCLTSDQQTVNSRMGTTCETKENNLQRLILHISQDIDDNSLTNTLPSNSTTEAVPEHLNHRINITSDPHSGTSSKCESNKLVKSNRVNVSATINPLPYDNKINITAPKRKSTSKSSYRRYECDVCQKKFPSTFWLDDHQIMTHRNNPFDSEHYPKYFSK